MDEKKLQEIISKIIRDSDNRNQEIDDPYHPGGDENKKTLLSWAVIHNDKKTVDSLIKADADTTIKDSTRRTALSYAAEEGYSDIVEMLLKTSEKESINVVELISGDKNGKTPLSYAAEKNHIAVIKLFLLFVRTYKEGVNIIIEAILQPDVKGRNAFSYAAEKNTVEFLNSFMEFSTNVKTKIVTKVLILEHLLNSDKQKKTPLTYAAEKDNIEFVDRLLTFYVKLSTDLKDRTDSRSVAKLLQLDKTGKNAFGYAVYNKKMDMIKKLLSFITKLPQYKYQKFYIFGLFKIGTKKIFIEAIKDNNLKALKEIINYKILLEENERIRRIRTNEYYNNKNVNQQTAKTSSEFMTVSMFYQGEDDIKNTEAFYYRKNGKNILHLAVEDNEREFLRNLLRLKKENEKNFINEEVINIKNNKGETPYFLATKNKLEVIKEIIKSYTEKHNINLLSQNQRLTDLIRFSEERESTGLRRSTETESEENAPSSEKRPRLDEAPGCSHWGRRRRRDLTSCFQEEGNEDDPHFFNYESLQEYVLVEQHQDVGLYTNIVASLAFQQGKPLGPLLSYQRNLGDILEEGLVNQSPREEMLIKRHYQQAQQFFQDNPKDTLLDEVPNDFEPLISRSVLVQSGQYSLLIFNKGTHYQLYSPDFNYRHLFYTRSGVIWSEMSVFIQAFFKWKTGFHEYHSVILKQNLPEEVIKKIQEAPFWKPDSMVSDSVLLARQQSLGIEGIPARVIRELVRVNGQAVDVTALHSDFFQQNADIKLRVDKLPSVLAELNNVQRQAVVRMVNSYHLSADSTLLNTLLTDEKILLSDYYQQVMNEIKTANTITPERLSEISWKLFNQEFDKYPDITPELKDQVLANLEQLHSTNTRRAWVKGMATQTLFFLPDMIRAANTGKAGGLVTTAGMLSTDATLNYSYEKLLEHLTPVLSETRVTLLRKLPITSPVFKALTVYSIVELTKSLQSLPPNSEQRQAIKHRLGEQYVTVGLMVAELLGFELGPLWVGLIAEQLIFEAINFRKENQLDIPFWEAFIMSLGFEQDKLQHILEERQLVEFNLANINKINDNIQIPYGWILVNIPFLGTGQWESIHENQVPIAIKEQIDSQLLPSISLPSLYDMFKMTNFFNGVDYSKIITSVNFSKEASGFRRISFTNNFIKEVNLTFNIFPNLEAGFKAFERSHFWYIENYRIQTTKIKMEWSPSSLNCQEDNIFLANPKGALVNYQRIASVTGKDYKLCSDKKPLKISGPGLAALYINKHNISNAIAQRNIYLGFDPREGDITLLIHPSGLQGLDDINQRYNPDYMNDTYSLTVQVGSKGYPSSILFEQPLLGSLMVEENSQRLYTNYFISSDTAPFYLYDNASTTRIFISPPRDQPIGFMVWNDDPTIFQLQTWSSNINNSYPSFPPIDKTPENLKKALQALLPQKISILHLPNTKKYLQLTLEKQQIVGILTLLAEQVDIIAAKGQNAYQSGIHMNKTVDKFTATILGHLQIKHGNNKLFFIGEKLADDSVIRYSNLPGFPHSLLYQLDLENIQLPFLDSLFRKNTSEIHFSTPGLKYKWIPDIEHTQTITLKILGISNGQRVQLLLEKNRTIFSHIDETPQRTLAVDHYIPHAELDNQLVFKKIVTQESILDQKDDYPSIVDKIFSERKGNILWFESVQGYPVIHRFPVQENLTLNGIHYQVRGDKLYAVGAFNGVIDGNQLIRYQTATGRVAIRFNSTLNNDTQVSLGEDSITINQLIISHLPKKSFIYFGDQGFTLQVLKESVQHSRQRRSLQEDELLVSGATSHKPWGSSLLKQYSILFGGVNWKWPNLLPSWRPTTVPSQVPILAISATNQPHYPTKNINMVGEYTLGHLQGLLQLLDLAVRKWMGERCHPLVIIPIDSLTEPEARLQSSLKQQCAVFSSCDNLAADPYRGYRVNTLSTTQYIFSEN